MVVPPTINPWLPPPPEPSAVSSPSRFGSIINSLVIAKLAVVGGSNAPTVLPFVRRSAFKLQQAFETPNVADGAGTTTGVFSMAMPAPPPIAISSNVPAVTGYRPQNSQKEKAPRSLRKRFMLISQ
jgi:hypothetical protein